VSKPIDFVIIWVDGNDKAWQTEKSKYSIGSNTDTNTHRYRDWDNLHYWFRGVEKFAPWVNKVHFVTWGHLPKWLNTKHPKLNIVNHKDYIPKEYLPTFSANPIELNLHRIKGLSDNFVYFNDDMFILDNVKEKDFFIDDLPCDSAVMNVHCYNLDEMYILTPFVDIGIINKYFDMHQTLKRNFSKWFSLKYGINMFRNMYLMPCPRFPGMLQQHLPTSFNKATFDILWNKEYETMHESSLNKFRHKLDANQWLLKEWQLASGNFVPRKLNIGKALSAEHIDEVCHFIIKQKRKMLCFNDVDMSFEEFEIAAEKVRKSFNAILPDKSGFEI